MPVSDRCINFWDRYNRRKERDAGEKYYTNLRNTFHKDHIEAQSILRIKRDQDEGAAMGAMLFYFGTVNSAGLAGLTVLKSGKYCSHYWIVRISST